MEFIWIILIVLIASLCAVLLGRKEKEKSMEELEIRAIEFGEECYIQGMIPIQKVKQLAQFYLVQESDGRVTWGEAIERIEKKIQNIQNM